MTLIVSWAGVDSRSTSSLYIASDSRIIWNTDTFDQGKKVFACRSHPEIFGYCGDVLFPLMVLTQIVDSIDHGVLYSSNTNYRTKTNRVKQRLIDSFNRYPHDVASIMRPSVEIIHGIRDDSDSSFHLMLLKWTRKERKWRYNECPIQKYSYQVRVSGSGAKEFNERYEGYKQKPDFKTSRAVYQTFCDTLIDTKETSVGGAPQLVGLYRKKESPGQMLGIVYKGHRYFCGMHIDNYPEKLFNKIEWRNELFERCDGKTKTIIGGAQKQPHI